MGVWVRPNALYPVQKHMHGSRIGFLSSFKTMNRKQTKKKNYFQTDSSVQETAPMGIIW